MNLKGEAISGVKWTSVSSVTVAVLQIIQLSILARFLDPSDFGLMALVMVVIGFSQAFLDMGVSAAIIHKQEITKDQLSTLYWTNLLAGFILLCIISIIAPYVADFYEDVELSKLIRLVGLTFLIQPFGQQFMVLWQKEMRFSEIAKIDVVNKSIALIVSVYFAYYGYGVYALVYGTLAGMVSQTIQFMYKGLQEYKPDFVCPFLFLEVTSEALYSFLKFSPPLSKAFEVLPIIHLPIILDPNLKQVFVTLQLFNILSGLSHLPLSSCTNKASFSPS